MRTILLSVLHLFRRRAAETRLDDEVRAHLDFLEAEYMRRGLPAEDARCAARRAFGGVEQMKERYREGRGAWFEYVRRSVRYAWRTAVRNPGYAATTIVTLALGIGANTARQSASSRSFSPSSVSMGCCRIWWHAPRRRSGFASRWAHRSWT
jgi:hypothetical protein